MNTTAKDLFARAHELEGKAREAFLKAACGKDAKLRLEVERLLVQAEKADSFFAHDSEGATMIENDPTFTESEGNHVGPYTLRQRIGEGGFGVVWMAEQTEPISRMVALKVVKAGMDTKQVLARFEAERQALAMMDHPNIAKVLDAGATESGRPYFAMELVKGVPITEFCQDQKFGPRRRLELFKDVCSAVNHAHQKGIIHRDLKPSNVMVTLHGDKPVVKVIDFGIAKATQQKLTDKTLFTRFEQFLGTPVYMSPEQAAMSGLDIDTRSDIYSLGVLLYELLTGKPPFNAKTLVNAGYDEMRRIIREVEPPKPSSRLSTMSDGERSTVAKAHNINPDKLVKLVSGDVDWIVMKSIDKDRARRYETANALAQDIGRHLNDEPVLAAAPSWRYRCEKFVRRNKTAVAVGATISALLVGGITATTWLAIAANAARGREAIQKTTAQKAQLAEKEQRLLTESTLQKLQIQQAEQHIESGRADLGLAYLARMVQDNPNHAVAARRLTNLLTYRNFPIPLEEPSVRCKLRKHFVPNTRIHPPTPMAINRLPIPENVQAAPGASLPQSEEDCSENKLRIHRWPATFIDFC